MTTATLSRKSFLQITAGALAGAAFLNMPHMAFANKAKAQSCAFADLPDAVSLAQRSELIQMSYNKIKESVATIQNSRLRQMTMDIIKNPNPTFMRQYLNNAAAKTAVYNKLVSLKLIDPAKTSLANFLPPYDGQTPQPFYSAPGSGYGSHHAYPGGLATHTAANLSISEGIYDTYINLFNSKISRDIVIAAQALHDLAKPLVFQWQNDQSSLKEYTIANTGAHHIFSIAEVIYRGFPVEEIVAQACAHQTPGSTNEEQTVVGFLTAAAIIAGKDAKAYGLVTANNTLPSPQKQEGYITSLGDHDYVLSGPACQKTVKLLQKIMTADYHMQASDLNGTQFNKVRNYIGAQVSMMYVNSLSSEADGEKLIRQLVSSLIIK